VDAQLPGAFGAAFRLSLAGAWSDVGAAPFRASVISQGLDCWVQLTLRRDELEALRAAIERAADGRSADFDATAGGLELSLRPQGTGRAALRLKLSGWSPAPYAVEASLSVAADDLRAMRAAMG
jgi:hypothetical protein